MDKFSKEKRSEIMSRIRSSRMKSEILFHKKKCEKVKRVNQRIKGNGVWSFGDLGA